METVLLSAALAAAAVAATVGWAKRNEEKMRAQRLADELTALRRSSSSQRMLEADTGSSPRIKAAVADEPAPAAAPPPDERLEAVERLLARTEEALAAALSRPRGSTLPIEGLRQESLDLLALLEKVESTAAPLPERGALLFAERMPDVPPEAPPPPAPFDTGPLSDGTRGTEDLADTARRLKDDLEGLLRSTDRLREVTSASADALGAVARGAEAIAPMAGALSSVANRVNLLALNLAVLVSPGAAGANVEEAGGELRSIFEEARRLSREVGALAQRVAAAARAAAERNADMAASVAEERARVERSVAGIAALDDLAQRLRKALDAVRGSAHESDEAKARLHESLKAVLAETHAFVAEVNAERHAVSAFAGDVCGACASVSEARLAADRAVRNLLAVAESASERRAAGPEAGALEAVKEARRLLRTPSAG